MIHSFCEDCIGESWAQLTGNPTCPICRKTVDGTTKMDMEMMRTMSVKSAPCLRCKKVVSPVACFDSGSSRSFVSLQLGRNLQRIIFLAIMVLPHRKEILASSLRALQSECS